jgi:hypothetical protein
MIEALLLCLGVLIGIAMVLISPEEVHPGRHYFERGALTAFLFAEIIIMYIFFFPIGNGEKFITLAIPIFALLITQWIVKKYSLIIHATITWSAIGYIGDISLLPIIATLIGTSLTFSYLCESCVRKEKITSKHAVFQKAVFFIPAFIGALILSI